LIKWEGGESLLKDMVTYLESNASNLNISGDEKLMRMIYYLTKGMLNPIKNTAVLKKCVKNSFLTKEFVKSMANAFGLKITCYVVNVL